MLLNSYNTIHIRTFRILEKRKEENNELRHDKPALLSRKKSDDTTKFIITLGEFFFS